MKSIKSTFNTFYLFKQKITPLTGASLLLDIGGTFFDYNLTNTAVESDWKAISNDWGVVGNDIREAIKCLDEEKAK